MPGSSGRSGDDDTLTPTQARALGHTTVSDVHVAQSGAGAGELPDRYQVGARLGSGGMGEVVIAIDRQIDREVAVKRMRVAPSPGAVARFVREAKVQGRLDHPAVVPVYELGTDSAGQPFFAMKRLAGETLASHLSRGSKTRQQLLRAFADVCLAVELAHTRGIVHRDLKPANLMLGDFGETYVLDWGVARIVGETEDPDAPPARYAIAPRAIASDQLHTEAGSILGTPGYIAPEVERGEVAGPRADVFALGRILADILGSGGDVPPELAALVADATRDAPDERLGSARALAERVEHFLDGDRDTAQRKQLAATHLAAARGAFASGGGDHARATAMREAGRALALDPTSDAAELISSLVVEPPRETPPEVEARLEQIDAEAARDKAFSVSIVVLSYLMFVPLLFWIGVRDLSWIGLFAIVVIVEAGYTMYSTWGRRTPDRRVVYIGIALNGLTIAIVARMFSPVLVAPGIAAVSMMTFAVDLRVRAWVVGAATLAGVFVPWLLELTGALSRTMSTSDGSLVLSPPAVTVHVPAAEVTMALYALSLTVLAGIAARRIGHASREAIRKTELQAWQLRQLATAPATSAGSAAASSAASAALAARSR